MTPITSILELSKINMQVILLVLFTIILYKIAIKEYLFLPYKAIMCFSFMYAVSIVYILGFVLPNKLLILSM